MEARPKWGVPEGSELRTMLRRECRVENPCLLDRYRFIREEFGPPGHMFLVGGIPAMFAITEMQRSFIHANYLAAILTAQLFIEQTLGGSPRAPQDAGQNAPSFSALIDDAMKHRGMPAELGERLHRLRRYRNPYVHHKEPLHPDGIISRLTESRLPEDVLAADASMAIQLVVDFLRSINPLWIPGNDGEAIYTV